jgi:hypothetical protein
MMQYRMFSNTELKNFRSWMATCPFDRSAEGAFDSKPKARDADPESAARGLAAMLLKLKEQLGTEDFKALCAKLCDEEPDAEDEGEETFASPEGREMDDKPAKDKKAKDKKTAKDSPPDFEGKPSTGAPWIARAILGLPSWATRCA